MNISFDIETVPDPRSSVEEYLENVQAPANYKKPDSIAQWKETHGRNVAEEQYRKTALDGLYGEICSIAWAIDDKPVQSFTRNETMSERVLLEGFFDSIGDEKARTRPTWIGHNLLEFDLKFLQQRCWIKKVKPTLYIPVGERHGAVVFDTMKAWAGYRGYVKQSVLCKALGIPFMEDMDGSMVYDAWLAGEYEKIRDYNESDVTAVREIYKRMTY